MKQIGMHPQYISFSLFDHKFVHPFVKSAAWGIVAMGYNMIHIVTMATNMMGCNQMGNQMGCKSLQPDELQPDGLQPAAHLVVVHLGLQSDGLWSGLGFPAENRCTHHER